MRTQELRTPTDYYHDIDAGIDINDYLAKRDADQHFFMVEFGHDAIPVAYQQPVPFYGDRVYLGVETWMRNPANNKPAMVRKTHEQYANNQNIFYTTIALDGSVYRDDSGVSWFDGTYNPETALPDGVASEVFLSNVLCDPQIAFNREFSHSLLSEVARITQESGMVVLRETITPHSVRHIDDELLSSVGLVVDAIIRPHDSEWQRLEQVYKGEPSSMPAKSDSYYMFLKKLV